MWASPTEVEKFGVGDGDLLVCEGGEGGRCAVVQGVPHPCIIQNALHRVRPRNGNCPKYLNYVMHAVSQVGWFDALMNRATIAHFTREKFGSLGIPLPPSDEQFAIVRFLDYADRRIRRYIRAKRKLIDLLNEQKQVIIHRAVTRGLDPNVPLKPSGVQWLGEVPQHWGARRAKFCYREVDDRSTTGSEELLSVSHITGVTPRSQKNITMFLAESNVGYKVCRPGDLVINTMWAWMAALGVSRQHGIVSPSYAVYRPLRPAELLGEYVDLLLRTWPYRAEYWCRSTGIRASRFRLYPDQFLRIPLLCPPVSEQEAIVGFAAAKTANLRDAIESAQKEIALLREHRTRLISDVVTGKLDVREAAADLPDEDGVEDLADVEDAEPPEPMEGAAEAEDTIAADE
jgi:type I restriction enzyme S subunit